MRAREGRNTRWAGILAAVLCAIGIVPGLSRGADFDGIVAGYRAGTHHELLAGAVLVDVTPRKAYTGSVNIAGFMPGRPSQGVRDPIYVHALFLHDGRTPLVIVSIDIIGYFYDEVLDIRRMVTRTYGDNIIIAATHNHEGPDVLGQWGPGVLIPFSTGVDKKYNAFLRRKIAEAIREAAVRARPAQIRFGSAMVPRTWCANIWGPPDQQDDEMSVMHVEDREGKAIATLMNYGCHAEALEMFNNKISSDFPGQFYKEWSSRVGGVPMFISGAGGGQIAPQAITGKTGSIGKFLRFSEEMGKGLADTAAQALAGSLPSRDIRLTLSKKTFVVPMNNAGFSFLFNNHIIERRQFDPGTLNPTTEVSVFGVGPARFVTVPGEPFPSLARAIKGMLPDKYKFLLTVTNDELGYMMMKDQFHDPTYEYESSVSLGENTGPIVLDAIQSLVTAPERNIPRQ